MIRVLGIRATWSLPWKARQQSGGAARIGLQRIGDQIGLFLIGMSSELGTLVQVQLPDHLQRHQIALQDADFGVEIALVVSSQYRASSL